MSNEYENAKSLINRQVWDAIGDDLGEVTNVEIIDYNREFFKSAIKYKSNGIDKIACFGEPKAQLKYLLQSLIYCVNAFGEPKKYTPLI